MNDFISTVRTDRIREIKKKQLEGIEIVDWNKYRIVDQIDVKIEDKKFTFGFQANSNDVYFFVIDGGANAYFSIVELYDLLKYICESGDEDIVIEVLEKIRVTEMKKILDSKNPYEEKWSNRGDFEYRGVTYHIKEIDYPKYDGIIEMLDGAGNMSYLQLFILINLVQEKSNAFFTRGETKNSEYVNGIVRLFICLIVGSKDYKNLNQLGWVYSDVEKKYVFKTEEIKNKGRKYYLTNEEYMDIMKLES